MVEDNQNEGARSLLLRTLKELGIEHKILDHERIEFEYVENDHTEVIVAYADDKSHFIKLFDYDWFRISKWDVKAITYLQQKVNRANIGTRAKVVYYFTKSDEMSLTSIMYFPFNARIPDYLHLFMAQLQCLRFTQQLITSESNMSEIIQQQ